MAGVLTQAVALGLVAAGSDFAVWLVAVVLLGAGSAMVHPTLLAAIGDVAHPTWRARSAGIHRLWRDSGFAVGAAVSGLVADTFGIPTAVAVVAALAAASGLVVALRMRPRGHHWTPSSSRSRPSRHEEPLTWPWPEGAASP